MFLNHLLGYLRTHCLAGCIAILCEIHILKRVHELWICQWKIIKGNQNFPRPIILKNVWLATQNFPGPSFILSLKVIWEIVSNTKDAFKAIIKVSETYPIERLWFGPRLIISVTTPKHFEIIMKSTECSEKSFLHKFMEPLIVNSLFNGHGPEMRAHRKLLVPMINGQHLINYMKTFNKETCRYIDALSVKTELEVFDIYNETQYCLADIAFETLFGIPGVAQNTGDLTLPHTAETVLDDMYHRFITPWLHPTFIFNLSKTGRSFKSARTTINKFMSRIIEEKKLLYMALERGESKAEKPKPSILDLLMENCVVTHAMDDQEILYEMITLFFGFYDTVLGVFSFTILMLAMHPDVQKKVREEVISVAGETNDIMSGNIETMKYMEMAIKETIRLFPVGPFLPRTATDNLQIEKYILPKGSTILMIPIITHRSIEHWNEPDKFIPERFLPENSIGRHPFAFVPFSGGSRSCPGAKFGMTCLKVMIGQLIRKYQFTTTMKLESMKLTTQISIRSQDGYKVSIQKINQA
ncbi:hypothetical protein PV327_003320 [Microctonus hyperodae]|uniref:Cytochrome P450 n=1 Tax=Microctonus hyperodae TaxID=165561 RepID=A0AA39G494_MICHY|nr:hypothetical protein PV327_003320 [Microctonus hyperodae]